MIQHQLQYAQGRFRWIAQEAFGNEFEKLFHRVMEHCHPDYLPIKTSGSLGDLGADGLCTRCRRLYACYAPETFSVAKVRTKFISDVESAIVQRPEQFDTFVFVHNDQRGIHPVVAGLLSEAGKDYPKICFQQMGPQKIWHEAMRLGRPAMEDVLGEKIPIDEVVYKIGMADIETLLKHLADNRNARAGSGPVALPTVVKADFNELSPWARQVLQDGRPYGYLIDQYYRDGMDMRERDEVADGFRAYYDLAREEYAADTDEIMWQMLRYVLGQDAGSWKREEAAKAVIACFFDECDIFEVPPVGWQPVHTVQGGSA
ncbi:ABC-three component system protein [Peterkaempfera bronchialis]|uniref:ABC-three component systems C-terminal domain-containing protein n=1 Tax=Peterkaempfera bronchialis TaxID=2126346 RepID=A0A345SYN1_9ACTN|nr:ABC-three component system protein [Peterkaempfera bronchialis]AXI78836.1 hypothetical protein C7M71_016865 [Peterkaempfera bronchialis]